MKKIVLLIFICLFCFGCEAEYKLYINDDLSVTEDIIGLETDAFYNNYNKSTKERVISFMMETSEEYLDEIGYSKDIVRQDNLTGAKVSKTFSSLEEYFNKSDAYKQFYDELDYKIKNGVVTINLDNQLLINYDSIDRYIIDNCDVSITLPFKVKKSNADFYNAKTNTYTWELSGREGKNIFIKFDTNKMADYNYEGEKFITYIIAGLVILGVLITLYVIYKKNKVNNVV